MGEIAEDMLDGSCCSLCGQYFEHPKGGIYVHEYPVACWDCYEADYGYPKADVQTFGEDKMEFKTFKKDY